MALRESFRSSRTPKADLALRSAAWRKRWRMYALASSGSLSSTITRSTKSCTCSTVGASAMRPGGLSEAPVPPSSSRTTSSVSAAARPASSRFSSRIAPRMARAIFSASNASIRPSRLRIFSIVTARLSVLQQFRKLLRCQPRLLQNSSQRSPGERLPIGDYNDSCTSIRHLPDECLMASLAPPRRILAACAPECRDHLARRNRRQAPHHTATSSDEVSLRRDSIAGLRSERTPSARAFSM